MIQNRDNTTNLSIYYQRAMENKLFLKISQILGVVFSVKFAKCLRTTSFTVGSFCYIVRIMMK